MNKDPNIGMVDLAAAALQPLLDDLVLVGGCAVGLLITDPASPAVRPTTDVDLIVEIAPASNYYRFCDKLKALGFQEKYSDSVICRWSKDVLIIDVMPVDETILGFTNNWYTSAVKSAGKHTLPSGLTINIISAPLFIATKIDSFLDRGKGDYLHHDIEDIINLINGRESINDEIVQASKDVREFLMDELEALLSDETFVEHVGWHLASSGQEMRLDIVVSRMRKIAGL